MRTSEVARRFLKYFEGKGHLVAPSASLVSPNPTTLFTIAGMVPFIPYLLGEQTPPCTRMASQQKCVRTLDIDEVGKTTRHGTFFQMLGNFSFGDYFKEEAIHYAWELLTTSQDDGGYGFDPSVLWITVFENDTETKDIWVKEGADPNHIQKLGMEDNFWTTGGPGPGGPCSEIYVDRGPQYGKDGGPIADDNRYIEIWDLVFENYEVDNVRSKTDLHIVGELKNKNIDTGMGLERVAYLLQGKENIYETDEMFPVIEAAEKLSGCHYGDSEENDIRLRIVADHVRSALMIMSDGVKPSNLSRGYVLRRLLRRVIRSMRMLGVNEPTLPILLEVSKDVMKLSYPELEEKFDDIARIAATEENNFRKTLNKGIEIFDLAAQKAKAENRTVISGEEAFQLHDTYGFPIELTIEMAHEQELTVDEDRFRELMQEQKNRARQDARNKRHNVDLSVYDDFKKTMTTSQTFLGYTEHSAQGTVLGIFTDQGSVKHVSAPASVEVVLDRTPFYAEKGGQLADKGQLTTVDGTTLDVDDVQTVIKDLVVHRCQLTDGELNVGDTVTATIDSDRRAALARSHTATHMLHQTLRDVLGPQAVQRGSVVAPDYLHFDYQADQAPSKETLRRIEVLVNQHIYENMPVSVEEMPIDQALEMGAMHLFGDKYGDIVRVVTIGNHTAWSRELCGGTHLKNSVQVGSFVILSDSSNGSGIRRIDAYCGEKAYEFYAQQHALVSELSENLNVRADDLSSRLNQLLEENKDIKKQLAKLQVQQLNALVPELIAQASTYSDQYNYAMKNIGNINDVDAIRSIVTNIREQLGNDKPSIVALSGISDSNRPLIFVAINKAAQSQGIKAGALVSTASKILGGGGGGRPDFAQGGGKDPEKINDALQQIAQEISKVFA